ncbi:cuticle protein 19.8-like [Adelges cooleyi]|uniref:cuticle protein 19.8-like n=1 Tax=Adelges cooleyi TaxID=133065 RepID=UPI00217F6DEB|nr:cuticle protein 19.8-like [Adelges cooleyi]
MRAFTVLSFLSVGVCLALAEDLPSSSFAYGVNDPATGDLKDQQEVRVGDSVSGRYRTLDADNFLRTVNYKADDLNGFTADVLRQPIVVPPVALDPAVAPGPVFESPESVYYEPAVAPGPVFESPESVYYEPAAVYHSAEPIAAYQPAAPAPVYHSTQPFAAYQPQEPIVYRSYSPLVYKSPEPAIFQQFAPPTFVKTTVVEPTPIVPAAPAVYATYTRPSISALIKSKFHKHPIVSALKKVGSYLTKKH